MAKGHRAGVTSIQTEDPVLVRSPGVTGSGSHRLAPAAAAEWLGECMGEVDQASLRRRLARLGSKQPGRAAQGVSPLPAVSRDPEISDAASPEIREQPDTILAPVVEKRYPLNTRHGHTLLGIFLQLTIVWEKLSRGSSTRKVFPLKE